MAKIILVEDEINIASFIERGLREFGHEVSVVYDGNAGWELLQNESFDLLILDIIMPGMNGLELCRMYRQRFGYHSPVVMLTALGTTDDIVKGLDAGADDLAEVRRRVQAQCNNTGNETLKADSSEQLERRNIYICEHYIIYNEELNKHRRCAEQLNINACDKGHRVEAAESGEEALLAQVPVFIERKEAEGMPIAQAHHRQHKRKDESEYNGQRGQGHGADKAVYKQLPVIPCQCKTLLSKEHRLSPFKLS